MAITYQTGTRTIAYIYRTSSGGTVFSSNLNASTAFDYFDDTAVVDDALYFGAATYGDFSRLRFKVVII